MPNPSVPRRSEAADATRRLWELVHLGEYGRRVRHDEELSDTIASAQRHRFCTVVDGNDLDLTSIPGVDDPWGVDDPHPQTNSQPAARRHQADVTLGYGNRQTRGNDCSLPRLERHAFARGQIEAGITRMSGLGQRNLRIQPADGYLHALRIVARQRKRSNLVMTTPHRPGEGPRLPGNDGSWFLKAVGVAAPATSLGDVGNDGDSTTELVQELWNTGGAPDAFEGWTPGELSTAVDSSRRFRWSIVVSVALAVTLLAASVVWVARSSDSRAAARADDYRVALSDIRSDLPNAQIVLAQLTEPAADASQFPELIPAVTDLRADAETALEIAADPLPRAWPLASTAPFEKLEPVRAATSQEATTAQAIARRLAEVLDYRTLFSRYLDTGELPATPPADLSALNLRLAAAAADTATVLSELPGDAALANHTQLARAGYERFVIWQVDYVDALRTGASEDVAALLDELSRMRSEVDQALVAAIARIRSEIDASIIELAASLDATVASLP